MARTEQRWIKVDVFMPDHAKIDGLSDAAFRLLVRLWCRAALLQSDGFVTTAWWSAQKAKARTELITAGLAHPETEGVRAHDYLDWQGSKQDYDELLAKRQEAGRRGGKAKASGLANALASARANGQAKPKQTPSKPLPDVDVDEDVDERQKLLTTLAAAPQNGHAAEPTIDRQLWDALVAASGIHAPDITGPMRGSLNKCVLELKTVGATPAEIALRARRYTLAMPEAKLTPPALVKHWATLSQPPAYEPGKVKNGW